MGIGEERIARHIASIFAFIRALHLSVEDLCATDKHDPYNSEKKQLSVFLFLPGRSEDARSCIVRVRRSKILARTRT